MGFQQGLSGLNLASKNLDVIGNNVSNASTVGYKGSQAQFADVFASSLSGASSSSVGLGGKLGVVVQQFTQGNITSTSNPLDFAINGGGFFTVNKPDGTVAYSRNGQFQLDKTGQIVNAEGDVLQGYLADAAGNIVKGSGTSIVISATDIAPVATGTSAAGTGVQLNANLDSREALPSVTPFAANNPLTYNQSTSVTVYDTKGNPNVLSSYFVKTGAGAWTVHNTLTNPSGTIIAPTAPVPATGQPITFSATGQLTSATNYTLTFPADASTGAAALSFKEDLTGSTEYGSKFSVNSASQDGYTTGKLTGFTTSADGIIKGTYSNGQSKNLAQLVLNTFRNPQGLQPIGNNLWLETSTSGVPVSGTPQTGQFGAIQASAVEDANVDLTAELVNMITAQRVYQANAQTIKTQDAVLQTLVNLR